MSDKAWDWQELSLAPATFVRSIARKLGADTDVEVPNVRKVYLYNSFLCLLSRLIPHSSVNFQDVAI